MPKPEDHSEPPSTTPGQLEKEETRLWRIAMLFLVFLASALAAASWDRLQSMPYHVSFLPIVVPCLAISFAAFTLRRRKRVSELKGRIQGLEQRASTPTEAQLDQLGQVISRSQRSFKELIDSFDDIAFAISLDGTIRSVNRRGTEFLGLSYGEVVGHGIVDLLDEPSPPDLERSLPHFLEGHHWSGTLQVRKKNSDRVLHFDCVFNAIVKDDEVVGASALARDVTEAREKERRFTELFETLQEGVYFSTPEGKLLEANAALVRMLGYSSTQELLALSPTDLNLDASKVSELGRSNGDQGNERAREISLRRKDGSTGIFLDTSRAVWDPAGKIIRYQGTLVDISERRAMEKTLQRQEEFQRYLLESFPDLILVIDCQERYSFVSSRIRDQLGHKPEDLLGKKITDQEQAVQFVTLCREVISGEKKFGFCEYDAHHRDGTWRTVRASASPLYDAENKISGVIMSARDITVERKLENQIIQSERLAAMGQMIGGFAHELNNPLTSVLGVSELLQDEEASEPVRKHLGILQQQARRAVEIVQNLLYFSRPPTPGRSVIDVNELVQRTLHLQAYSLRKNNITVDFLPEHSLPPVNGDPHQIMQVFLNLVLNAEQAIREVRDKGTLLIRVGKNDDGIAVMFRDDGPGITPDVIPNIFDPFYTTKRPGRGTGLGLSICKAILREHGGNVEVACGPAGGAVFTVTLPAAAGTLAATMSSGT